jgi:hypothetical protein
MLAPRFCRQEVFGKIGRDLAPLGDLMQFLAGQLLHFGDDKQFQLIGVFGALGVEQ